jgi:hypothetical protein
VPNVTGNAALDVLIGLFFLYFLLSIVCSSVNEGISAIFNLRAKDLERGIQNLLGGKASADDFYAHWRVQSLFKPPGRFFTDRRKPSYIPSRIFALTVLEKFAPPAHKEDPHGPIDNVRVRLLLQAALDETRADVERSRAALEQSFDEVMDRASGWYKRRIQLILLVLSLGLVGAINADSFAVAQRLWKDDALRAAVVAQADRAVSAGQSSCPAAPAAMPAMTKAADCVDDVTALGIPFGWSHDTSPHGLLDGFGKLLGLLVTAFALTLGAPFWFDLLGKVAHLRGSGAPTGGAEEKAAAAATT